MYWSYLITGVFPDLFKPENNIFLLVNNEGGRRIRHVRMEEKEKEKEGQTGRRAETKFL